jgi:hypothetical protein
VIRKRRRLAYSLSVLGAGLAGVVVLTVLTALLDGEGTSPGDALNRLVFVSLWGWILTLPLMVIFTTTLFLSTVPFRHVHWWVGLIAGAAAVTVAACWVILPGLIMTLSGTGSWSYVGTPDEIAAANLRDLLIQLALAGWCLASAVLFAPLLKGPRERAKPGSPAISNNTTVIAQ